MSQLRRDIVRHPRVVTAFFVLWLGLTVVQSLVFESAGGVPGWLMPVHSLLLPFAAGIATSDFKLSSAHAGAGASVVNLLVICLIQFSTGPRQVLTPEQIAERGPSDLPMLIPLALGMGLLGSLMGGLGEATGLRFPWLARR
jgi:hypothetical protein